jgi:hypothetical protein
VSTKNWCCDSASKERTQPGGSSRISSSMERRRSGGIPLRSVRAAGPSVETLANGSGADEEPVALSYDGGGSSGGCCVDILDACAQAIGRLIPPRWMLSLESVIGMNKLDIFSCLGADQTARGVVVGEVPGGVELRVEHNYLAMTTAPVAQTAGPSSPGRNQT